MTGVRGSAGIFTTDGALVVRSWDRWLADATGIAEDEARGRPVAEVVPELEARGLLARLRRVRDEGTVEVLAPAFHAYFVPCPPRTPSAHFAHMQQHVTIAPLRAGESIAGLVVTIEDVTARRDRERDLVAQLQSPDDAERLHAARALAVEPGTSAPLAGALGDASWRVRRAAADGLAAAGDDGVVATLLDAVRERHRDPAVLNAALTALAASRQDVLPALRDAFEQATDDADLRTYLALALGMLGDPRATAALVQALDDPDANVRFHVIEALGRIGDRAAALPLARIAEAGDFTVAFAALDAVALVGEPSVAPHVVPLLDDALLHEAAAEALGQLGREDAVGPLAAQLARPGASVGAVARALAAVHGRFEQAAGEGALVADLARAVVGPDLHRRLVDALPDAADTDRSALLCVLGWLDVAGGEPVLAPMLTPMVPAMLADDATRRITVDLLARGGSAAVPSLLDALRDEQAETRKAAAAALGRVGARESVPGLVALLADSPDSPDVAVAAAGALAGIGDPRALDALLGCLDDPQPSVRRAAAAAIDSIGHAELADRVRALLADPSPRVREAAAGIAGYFAFPECLDPMLGCCRDADETVRRAAVEQLAQFDDPRALAALVDALGAGTPLVRAAAARGLAHAAPADALPHVRTACGDADPWVRYYAARSAGHLRRREPVPELLRLATSDPVPPVRIAAVEALTEIGTTGGSAPAADALEIAGALRPLATDDDPMVARAGIAAIGRRGDLAAVPVVVAALESDDAGRRGAALDALAALASTASDAGRDALAGDSVVAAVAAQAATAADAQVRASALQLLARVGGPAAVSALVALAAAPARARSVADALARLDATALPWLERALAPADVSARCVVMEALGRMTDPASAALLAGALEDDAPAVRHAAAQALARRDLRAARWRTGAVG